MNLSPASKKLQSVALQTELTHEKTMNSSQLSLFNTNTATGNVYRAGDWVKVRKNLVSLHGLNAAKFSKSIKYTR
jgi:hypothetical protein